MQSYQARYDRFLELEATIIAISGDREATAAEFRREIGAAFSFVADGKGELMRSYGLKQPLVNLARRMTFVVGRGREILHIDRGRSAVDSEGAAAACELYPAPPASG